jgi:hypothetical protein
MITEAVSIIFASVKMFSASETMLSANIQAIDIKGLRATTDFEHELRGFEHAQSLCEDLLSGRERLFND